MRSRRSSRVMPALLTRMEILPLMGRNFFPPATESADDASSTRPRPAIPLLRRADGGCPGSSWPCQSRWRLRGPVHRQFAPIPRDAPVTRQSRRRVTKSARSASNSPGQSGDGPAHLSPVNLLGNNIQQSTDGTQMGVGDDYEPTFRRRAALLPLFPGQFAGPDHQQGPPTRSPSRTSLWHRSSAGRAAPATCPHTRNIREKKWPRLLTMATIPRRRPGDGFRAG